MLLRDHPKMQPWPPTDWICDDPKLSPDEAVSLRLTSVAPRTPALLDMVFDYNGNDCHVRRNFTGEAETLVIVLDKLRGSIGYTLEQIGNLNI
jgi:hypothetical protein